MAEPVNHDAEVAEQIKIAEQVQAPPAPELESEYTVRLAGGFDAPVYVEVAGNGLQLEPGKTYTVTAEQFRLFEPLDAVEAA